MFQAKKIFRPIYAPLFRRYRRRADILSDQRRIREAVSSGLESGRPIRIILGAGKTRYEGWIPTDIPAFDVLVSRHWQLLFPPESIDRMLAEHVFEHLTTAQFGDFLEFAKSHLSQAGRIRIAVPDGHHPDSSYIARVRPGGSGEGADDHKVLYTFELIGGLLSENGYQYQLLEHFDAAGQFNRHEWSAEDGFISRSAEHDRRNGGGQLNYTSLIVDCWL